MNHFTCELCQGNFNSHDKKPHFLQCGHTFCTSCIQSSFNDTNNLTCWSVDHDQSLTFTSYSSISEVPINRTLLGDIKRAEVNCSFHENILATQIDLSKAEAYCRNCDNSTPDPIKLEFLSSQLDLSLESYRNSYRVNDNDRREIDIAKQKPNRDKLALLKILIFITNEVYCEIHQTKQAYGINFKTNKVLCRDCIGQDIFFFVRINKEGFEDIILNRIRWIRRAVEYRDDKLLTLKYEDLLLKSKIELIWDFKQLQKNIISAKIYTNSIKCLSCKTCFSINNPPWVFPCIGGYTICSYCNNNNISVICQYCRIPHLTSSSELLFSFDNPIPFCSYCKQPFNLKSKFPKELHCGHVLCLDCLKSNYIQRDNRRSRTEFSRCHVCNEQINNLLGVKDCSFLINQVKNNLIYCTKHRNVEAVVIEKNTLRTWCLDCVPQYTDEKIWISLITCTKHRNLEAVAIGTNTEKKMISTFCSDCEPNYIDEKIRISKFQMAVNEYLLYRFNLLLEHDPEFKSNSHVTFQEFKTLSNQQMIDEIRAALEPSSIKTLLSTMPNGRTINGHESPAGSFVLRFFSVMPPVVKNEEFLQFCKPWKVDTSRNQIEGLVAKCNSKIYIKGVFIGKPLYSTRVYIDLFEILKGNEISATAERKFSCNTILKIQGEVEEEKNSNIKFESFQENKYEIGKVLINESIEIEENEEFCIVFRMRGDNIILFRGNPFDRKQEAFGSDNKLFQFYQPLYSSEVFLDGQSNLTGPIIGLIYE